MSLNDDFVESKLNYSNNFFKTKGPGGPGFIEIRKVLFALPACFVAGILAGVCFVLKMVSE
jgi:hypothetical protein